MLEQRKHVVEIYSDCLPLPFELTELILLYAGLLRYGTKSISFTVY
jgi:hypothetical protein